MAQQFAGQIKIRTALLIFLKDNATPVVIYPENPIQAYEDIKQQIKSTTAVLIEKEAQGPIKKLCLLSNQIQGLGLQDEQYK